jgi:hypothetical protein
MIVYKPDFCDIYRGRRSSSLYVWAIKAKTMHYSTTVSICLMKLQKIMIKYFLHRITAASNALLMQSLHSLNTKNLLSTDWEARLQIDKSVLNINK